MRRHVVLIFFSLALLASSCDGGRGTLNVSADSFDFDPLFSKTTDVASDPSLLVAPRSLAAAADGGWVTVSWRMPKYYALEKYGVTYRLFLKTAASDGAGSWDFATPYSSDRSYLWGVYKSSDKAVCSASGLCSVTVRTGGPKTVLIALMATDQSAKVPAGGRESQPVATRVVTGYEIDDRRYDVGFIDGKFGGALQSDQPTPWPSLSTFSFAPTALEPWLLPGDGFVASNWYSTPSYTDGRGRPTAGISPQVTSVDKTGDYASFSDKGNHRVIVKARQSVSACDSSRGTPIYEECVRIIRQAPSVPQVVVGQPSQSSSYDQSTNPLGPARSFSGGTYASSIQRDSSGAIWFFVADRARLLVRRGIPGPCSLEEISSFSRDAGGVLSSGVAAGPEGSCGFQWSIGTASPRLTCGLRADGSEASGDEPCTEPDMAKTLADATAPSPASLRYPGAPLIAGDHLYIPDAGNARILRLANFKTALESCGRLKGPGAPSDARCRFDMVLGQTKSTEGAEDQFRRRKCVRGGERGGKDGLSVLADHIGIRDPLEPECAVSSDPVCAGNTGTGIACLLDTLTETVSGDVPYEIVRKKRQAKDFRNQSPGAGMMSPATGLLSDEALAMFRFPLSIHKDHRGRILVFDVGYTFAEEASASPRHAVLGPRVMVWNRDPLALPDCPAAGDCAISAAGICEGPDCATRSCRGAECQAYAAIGQKNAKFAHGGFTGPVVTPDRGAGDFVPINAVSIPETEEGRGIWAVTGGDRTVYRWREADQYETPDVHNREQKNGLGGEIMLGGALSGIEVDTSAATVSVLDPIKNFIMRWTAPSTLDGGPANPFGF
jgi:hypothetical protein